jgi:hypothetical protein
MGTEYIATISVLLGDGRGTSRIKTKEASAASSAGHDDRQPKLEVGTDAFWQVRLKIESSSVAVSSAAAWLWPSGRVWPAKVQTECDLSATHRQAISLQLRTICQIREKAALGSCGSVRAAGAESTPAKPSFCKESPLRRLLPTNSRPSVPKNASHESKPEVAVKLAVPVTGPTDGKTFAPGFVRRRPRFLGSTYETL